MQAPLLLVPDQDFRCGESLKQRLAAMANTYWPKLLPEQP
jgi:hypothetical protein